MTITATFSNYEEMVDFAKNLLQQEISTKAQPTEAAGAVAEPEPEPVKEEKAPAAEEKTYSMTEVRAYLGNLRKAGKKEAVTALIHDLGYEKFTDVPAEKYGELMKKAEEL